MSATETPDTQGISEMFRGSAALARELHLLRSLAAACVATSMCEDVMAAAVAARGARTTYGTTDILALISLTSRKPRLTDAQVAMMLNLAERFAHINGKWPAFNSAHEGLGVLLEEVNELQDEVFRKQGDRDPEHMRRECLDIAVAALRFISGVCDAGQVRK